MTWDNFVVHDVNNSKLSPPMDIDIQVLTYKYNCGIIHAISDSGIIPPSGTTLHYIVIV